MNIQVACELIEREGRFVASIEAECEKREDGFNSRLERCRSLPEAEFVMLEHVKFVGSILEALRRRNKELSKELGMNYAKIIGLATPYEEAIRAMRNVKSEFDIALKVLRERMSFSIKREQNRRSYGKKNRI